MAFDAAKHWVGLPAYEPGVKAPELRVRFRTERDRKRFIRQLGLILSAGQEWHGVVATAETEG